MVQNTVDIEKLRGAITDLEAQLAVLTDLPAQIDNVKGSYQTVRDFGIDTTEYRRDALHLETSLNYQILHLKNSLSIWESSGVE